MFIRLREHVQMLRVERKLVLFESTFGIRCVFEVDQMVVDDVDVVEATSLYFEGID